MKKIIMAVLFAAAALPVSAGNIKIGFDGQAPGSLGSGADSPLVSAPTPAEEKGFFSKAPAKEWTVMVFVNGKNNLEMAGLYNVNEMEKVGSTPKMNIVVEMGRMKGQDGDTNMDGDWTGSRRYYIKKDNDTEKMNSIEVGRAERSDMGDYKDAVDFVKWAKQVFPARRYMLILWDHGSGWMDPQMKPKGDGKGISFDDETGNYIRTKQIGSILKETGGVDVLAFDACLMQMGEVAFEVKDLTKVIIGSEETVPAYGYPYSLFLGALAKNPAMTNADLGRTVVASYKAFYDALPNKDGSKKPVQLSAIRSDKLGELGAMLKDFSAAAKDLGDLDALKAARAGVIRYDMLGGDSDPAMSISFYGDLHQYAGLLAANLKGGDVMATKAASVKSKAAALQTFIDRQLVIDNAAIGKNRAGHEMTDSHGISVYLPPAETRIAQERLESIFEGKYADFEFSKATGWHDYVTFLYSIKPEAPIRAPLMAVSHGKR